MSSKRLYNYPQIHRYLQKQMSPPEMHAFEKTMMNDPFLADALEGYNNSNDALNKKHLAEIFTWIKPARNETSILNKISARWLKIAAILVFVIGATIATYTISNQEIENPQIAEIKNTQPSSAVDSIASADEPYTEKKAYVQSAPANNTMAFSRVYAQKATDKIAPEVVPFAMKPGNLPVDTMPGENVDKRLKSEELSSLKSTTSAKALKNISGDVDSLNVDEQNKDGWAKLQAYIDKEVNKAKEKNKALKGMNVQVEFSIGKNGQVDDIKILNASNTEVAKIATGILSKSPRLAPTSTNARAKIFISF